MTKPSEAAEVNPEKSTENLNTEPDTEPLFVEGTRLPIIRIPLYHPI
jgi:hypothetical protein